MLTETMKALLDMGLKRFAERERLWWSTETHGRWFVLEPGPGRHLKGVTQTIRDCANAHSRQRGRRFTSLSRARAFARQCGGKVYRWRRDMPFMNGRPLLKFTDPWHAVMFRRGIDTGT